MSSLFPTDPTQLKIASRGARVEFPDSWPFDHENGDLQVDTTGKTTKVSGVDAYREWALKALMTPRRRHPIYSRQYGSEVDELRRMNLAPGVLQSEIQRTITETLMADPRTKGVGDFSFERSGSDLTVSFTVTTVQDETVSITVPTGGNQI